METFAPVVTAGGLVHASGVIARDRGPGTDIESQVTEVLDRLDEVLRGAGSSLARAASMHVQVRHAADFAGMNRAYAARIGAEPPARTTVVAPPEADDALVEISAIAAAAGTTREVLHPAGWPQSPNPYSHGIRCGDTVFLSGLVPRDVRTGTPLDDAIEAQVDLIADNATALLAAAGLTLADVVLARVFITDVAEFAAMNARYRASMPAPRPARATVVTGLMQPAYRVEMTFVAQAGRSVTGVVAPVAEDALLVPAIAASPRVFLSGALGEDPHASIEAQTRSTMARLGDVLARSGLDWSHVVDATLYVTGAGDAEPARRVMREAMGRPLPAGATLACGLVVPHAGVEVQVTAVRP
jgi:2-iminobutanoate/2-iminopropanoate deaminase